MAELRQNSVAIIGAGPAGLLLARQLALAGFSVDVYEARSEQRRKICGEYLCPAGVRLLRQLGLSLPSHFLPVRGMRLVTPWQTEIIGDFPQDQLGESSGASVPRDRFDQWLGQAASEAGATIHTGITLKQLSPTPEGFELEFLDGLKKNCHLLVGADGRQSLVARLSDLEGGHDFSRLALHAYLPLREGLLPDRRGEMHLLGNGMYIGLDPVTPTELNVTLALPAEVLRQFNSPQACLKHYWDQHDHVRRRFGEWPLECKVFSLAPINHHTRKVQTRNLALIGDAAGLVDPLTGEGIYNALLSAQLLSHALIRQRQDWNGVYQVAFDRMLGPKKRLNQLLQLVIRWRSIMAVVEWFLRQRAHRAHHFIGIIGNVWTPWQGMKKMLGPP